MQFVGRISGIVTYSDDSHEQFAAHLDDAGNISVNSGSSDSPNESAQAVAEVQSDQNWLEGMIDLVSTTLAFSPGETPAKVVTDLVAEFSGRVARDDDTWEDFAAQYTSQSGAHVLNSSGEGSSEVDAYTEFVSATLTTWFETMVGSGNVTV